MKRIFLPLLICLLFIRPLHAQHFVGDIMLAGGNTAVFTVKPEGGDITGKISLLEYYLRWDESFGNGFTFTSIINNTTDFPGINIVTTNNDVTDSGYNNQHFAFTGLTTAGKTYVQDSVYEVFRVVIGGVIPPAFHLVANNETGIPYSFTVQGDSGTDYTPYTVSPFVLPTDSAGSFFYKTYMYSILSVGLVSFNGSVADCSAHLNWVTSGEIPGSHFEIQQSKDGASFITIKSITGVGWQNGYDYEATAPMMPGDNYFRIRIVSVNEREQFSKIIVLKNNCSNIYIIQAAPNPVTAGIASLLVTVGAESNLDIALMSISGRQMTKYTRHVYSGINKVQLPLPKIAAGQYIITVCSSNNGRAAQKIFVQ